MLQFGGFEWFFVFVNAGSLAALTVFSYFGRAGFPGDLSWSGVILV